MRCAVTGLIGAQADVLPALRPPHFDSDRVAPIVGGDQAPLDRQIVALESDPSQGDADRYDRLLRYIWLPDGPRCNQDESRVSLTPKMSLHHTDTPRLIEEGLRVGELWRSLPLV